MFQQQKPQLGTDLSSNLNLHHKSLNSQNSFELHTIVEASESKNYSEIFNVNGQKYSFWFVSTAGTVLGGIVLIKLTNFDPNKPRTVQCSVSEDPWEAQRRGKSSD